MGEPLLQFRAGLLPRLPLTGQGCVKVYGDRVGTDRLWRGGVGKRAAPEACDLHPEQGLGLGLQWGVGAWWVKVGA